MEKKISKKRIRGLLKNPITAILVFIIICAILLIILFLARLIIKAGIEASHNSAVEQYLASNNVNITENTDGSLTIQGYTDGVPFGYVENNTFCDGITLDGVPIGGSTYDEVIEMYYRNINDLFGNICYSVNYGNMTYIVDSSAFGFSTNIESVLTEAFRIGRESDTDFLANYNKRLQVASEGLNLTAEISIDEEKLGDFIDKIATQFDTPAVEPYITLRNLQGGGKPGVGVGGSSQDVYATQILKIGKIEIAEAIFHNGSAGMVVNRETLKQHILDEYQAGNYSTEIVPDFEQVLPTSTADELKDNFGRLSMAYTDFESSGTNRTRNVQKAAALLNCIEMVPGEELTYNTILGPRTEADGWLQAAGISGGKEYVDSPGGGICQVSSTLYNALLIVGPNIEITNRSHHSIPSSYIALGLDATVSSYGPDLAWVNNSDSSYFLISYADVNAKRIYCCVYGVKSSEGYTYKMRSELIETEEPEAPLMVAEPLWPKGYQVYTITPRNRYVVDVYRDVYDASGNKIDTEYMYRDVYKSVRGEIHYGTGDPSLPQPT